MVYLILGQQSACLRKLALSYGKKRIGSRKHKPETKNSIPSIRSNNPKNIHCFFDSGSSLGEKKKVIHCQRSTMSNPNPTATSIDAATMAVQICHQIQSIFSLPLPNDISPPLDVLTTVLTGLRGRVFVYGVGREGLMMKALCMRLFHLGLSAHVVGDMTTPPIAASDLLLASAGPGDFSTVNAICGVAKNAGARVVLITAKPDTESEARRCADEVVFVPAQTMADREEERRAGEVRLPMGSLYEGALFVLFEMAVIKLGEVMGQSPAEMRARHTNLE